MLTDPINLPCSELPSLNILAALTRKTDGARTWKNHTYPSTRIYRHVQLHCYRITSTAINYPNIVCSKSKTEPNVNTVPDIYWKRKTERKRESELTYPPARPCSTSNLQCESQLESLGFSVAPPTQCHVTLTTPPQLQQWKKEKRWPEEREKESRRPICLTKHTHKA